MKLLMILLLLLYTFACVVLIFVILIQSGKGGGLSSLGASSGGISDTLGATGAEKALNKLTTYCAVGFMVLAILLSIFGSRNARTGDRPVFDEIDAPVTAGSTSPGTAVDLPSGLGTVTDLPPLEPGSGAN
jgi:preprotein translocase subunit SecG